PEQIIPLSPEGSQREYFRIIFRSILGLQSSLIGVRGNVIKENNAFIHISKQLCRKSVALPTIEATSNDHIIYIQHDLGDTSLYDLISQNGFTTKIIELIKKTFDELIKFQIIGAENIDTDICFPVKRMDNVSISWDLNYFKYCFLKVHDLEIDEVLLEKEFQDLTSAIIQSQPQLLVHRDFQSRNIMVKDGNPWLIDFQGARIGPSLYDPISFLWQSRIAMPDNLKEELLNYYIERLEMLDSDRIVINRSNIWNIVIFRLLQVLGAYGFRGLIQGKPKFRAHIPQAIEYLINAIDKTDGTYLYLRDILNVCKAQYHRNSNITVNERKELLTIDICSFSFKKGYPKDDSGNGGGFVFDCRAIHNPGRYDEYKNLTGNDQAVKDFFKLNSDIDIFLDDCFKLVDRTIEVYLRRGFTHLSISFGCTGGQHRSLFSANAMAIHIHEKYPVVVKVLHREQNIEYTLNPQQD
ncbi:MAG: phosphotransferase, partial [Muribaculaceae bacterium]|nr:phosphotransferase [Muribaculaceae bacterium]